MSAMAHSQFCFKTTNLSLLNWKNILRTEEKRTEIKADLDVDHFHGEV